MRTSEVRWVIALSVLGIVIPIMLYLITGTILSLLVPCSDAAGFTVLTYRGDTIVFSCVMIRTTIKLVVALWGSTVILFGAFLLGTIAIQE